ncbi:MAG TPA: segregation/condensation protein A [Bryocella sp.]|nr:segregation/condensation protein A [Bryocella sp.]
MADEIQNPAIENSELKTENSELEAQRLEAGSSQRSAEPAPATDNGGRATDNASAEPFRLQSPPTPAPEEPKKPAPKKDPEEASQSPFTVTVGAVYDGPFDLLLDLIRKQNIDIYDIPIARITAQFLEYTRHLQQTDVDSAGEFVYTASLLIHIKSRMLLPRDPKELGDLGNAEDPRRELVERLLEHERFKAAAQMLSQKQQIEEATWTNPGLKQFLKDQGLESTDDDREIAADTVDLVRVFQEILQRLRERPVHTIDEDTVTVGQMIDYVKRRLTMEDKPVSLRKLLANTRSERSLICTFLAMLELVRLQAILLRQAESLGDILIKKADHFDQVMADESSVRDDWG